MTANEIRDILDFCKKHHQIIASDSIVVKNDPTLMFTNAGMNRFKDVFGQHTCSIRPHSQQPKVPAGFRKTQ